MVGKLSLQWLNLSTEFHYLTEWKSVQGYSQSARQRGKMPLVNCENKVFISPNSPLKTIEDSTENHIKLAKILLKSYQKDHAAFSKVDQNQ